MPKIRPNSFGFGVAGISVDLGVEYVASHKDLARRVLLILEDRRVLDTRMGTLREDHELCRKSADEIRKFLTVEMYNVKPGGPLEDCFGKMRAVCRAFVTAAGANASSFADDQKYFQGCLVAFREAMGVQIGWLAVMFDIPIEEQLMAIIPKQDVSWLPGFDPTQD